VLLNAGDGTFPTIIELPGGSSSTRSIAAADVDGDGDLDVLLGSVGSPSRVLLNAGDGTFPSSIELPGGSASTSSIAAAKLLTQPQNSWLTIGSSDLLKWDFLVACSSTSFRDWRLLSAIKPKGKKNTEPLPAMPTANGTLVAWESWEVYF
jgi:hypothetical protein